MQVDRRGSISVEGGGSCRNARPTDPSALDLRLQACPPGSGLLRVCGSAAFAVLAYLEPAGHALSGEPQRVQGMARAGGGTGSRGAGKESGESAAAASAQAHLWRRNFIFPLAACRLAARSRCLACAALALASSTSG